MSEYNTGNPIGSADVRDLHDNAVSLDEAVNSGARSFVDRLGNTRKTLSSIEQDAIAASSRGSTHSIPLRIKSFDTSKSGPCRGVAVIGNYGIVGCTDRDSIQVFDLSDPLMPTYINELEVGISIRNLYLYGRFIYAMGRGGICVVDVSDARNPKLIQTVPIDNDEISTGSIEVSPYAYAYNDKLIFGKHISTTSDVAGVQMYSIGTDGSLTLVNEPADSTNFQVRTVSGLGNTVFVVGSDGSSTSVRSYAIGETDLTQMDSVGLTGLVSGSTVSGHVLYIGGWGGRVTSVDVADPAELTVLDSISGSTGRHINYMTVRSGLLFASASGVLSGITVYDITDPSSLTLITDFDHKSNAASAAVGGETMGDLTGLRFFNDALMVGVCGGGDGAKLFIVDVSNPYSPCVISGKYETTIGGRNLARSGGLLFSASINHDNVTSYDVSDITRVRKISSLTTPQLNGARGIALKGRYAFVGARDSGSLVVVDVFDPHNMSQVSYITDASLMGIRGLALNGKYLYAAIGNESTKALATFDVSDPASPELVGTQATTQRVNVCLIAGNTMYVIGYIDSDSFYVFDISNPASPALVNTVSSSNLDDPRTASLDETGTVLFVTSTNGNFVAFDVSDRGSISEIGYIHSPSMGGARSSQRQGGVVYIAARSADGIVAVDVSDPSNMQVAGFIGGQLFDDTYGLLACPDAVFATSEIGHAIVAIG